MLKVNEVYNGDCLELMSQINDQSIDYVFTSPPYNFGDDKYKEFSDNKSQEEYFDWTKNVINELLRITKETIFYNIQMISGNKISLLKTLGFFAEYIKDIIIWDKMMAEPAIQKNVLNSQFEFIICLNKNNNKRMFGGAADFWGTIPNILKFKKNSSNEFSNLNKATFVKELPSFFIQNFTKENDIILDPFMGTGQTAIVCQELHRNYIGIEISEELCKLSQERLKQQTLF